MRRTVFKKAAVWLAMVTLALPLLGPGVALGETMKVTQPNQSIYPDPDFAGTPIATVPQGAEVTVQQQTGDWYKVEYQRKSGWMNRTAFSAPAVGGPKFGLGSLLGVAPAKETSSNEAALAGKGFTPEVESSYRQKHPEMKFSEVDKVEAVKVDSAKLQAFIKEGGLAQ